MANAATWAERVDEWRKSGLSGPKFAEGRDFSSHQLFYWRAKIRGANEGQEGPMPNQGGPADMRLARVVRVASTGASVAPLAVELHGVRVVVPRGFDRATFSVVLDEIEARAARAGR
jgi:hypothetical protein